MKFKRTFWFVTFTKKIFFYFSKVKISQNNVLKFLSDRTTVTKLFHDVYVDVRVKKN